MPRLFLASSALKSENFDCRRTIEEARTNDFHGVQLYMSDREVAKGAGYIRTLGDETDSAGLEVIAHLPNAPLSTHLDAARTLMEGQKKKPAVLHYEPRTPLNLDATEVRHLDLQLENCRSGFDIEYEDQVLHAAQSAKFGYVFDVDRIFVGDDGSRRDEITEFARRQIPKADILHLIDRSSWPTTNRGSWRAFGNGVYKTLVPSVRTFSGSVVFEHESLDQAVESKRNLE